MIGISAPGQGIAELAAYHESLRKAETDKLELLQALRPMLGRLVNVTGMPATYTSRLCLGIGQPKYWETPVYPLDLGQKSPREPMTFMGHLLLSAIPKGIEVSATDKSPLQPDFTPASGGILLYSFPFEDILSITPAEPERV